MDHANATFADMVVEHAITAAERARMVIGVWPRARRDLLAPFAREQRFSGLRVEHCETNTLVDAAWADYQRDGNAGALANKHALFFRTIFAPTLAGALERNRDAERLRDFSDRIELGLKQRLLNRPEPITSLVETIVVAKNDEP
jgi:hypothetical protein